MKTNIFILGLFLVLLNSCSTPSYLPSSDQIDVNEYGSHIRFRTAYSDIEGELIAIDSTEITVLLAEKRTCVTFPLNEVKLFKLTYAQPKQYGWKIPVYTLATIAHGWWLTLTAPLNLIVTISVTASGDNAFTYSDKNMTYDKLRMFARFPQGIPPHIELESIN